MKTLIPAAIRCSLMFTSVAALSLAYPASVQAVPTTYVYTGNRFTIATGAYSTSDFVTAMVTLASPLASNMPLTGVTPIAFSLSDGVQTFNPSDAIDTFFSFATGPTGDITDWSVGAEEFLEGMAIITENTALRARDLGFGGFAEGGVGMNENSPGSWIIATRTPDAGSTLSLMTLTLMALGVVARQFKRAAA